MGLSRSTFYANPQNKPSDAELVAVRAITDVFECYGYRRVCAELRHRGHLVNAKKVRRLMREHDLNLVDLVAAIRDGHLAVGQRMKVAGFHGLVVRTRDVDALAPSHRRARAPQGADIAGMTSAASFGRSVGLRDDGNFLALVEAGQMESQKTTTIDLVAAPEGVEPSTYRLGGGCSIL
jgi:hypothetical protein